MTLSLNSKAAVGQTETQPPHRRHLLVLMLQAMGSSTCEHAIYFVYLVVKSVWKGILLFSKPPFSFLRIDLFDVLKFPYKVASKLSHTKCNSSVLRTFNVFSKSHFCLQVQEAVR
jgi:hypothetical protein